MQTWMLMVLWLAGGHGGGVTKTDEDGISKYWDEDIKALEHVYGKTSDKELYGATLPPNVIFNVATTEQRTTTEIKDPFVISDLVQPSPTYPYNYLFQKQIPKVSKVERPEPSNNYIRYSEFEPISQATDPQTYNYLKRLEKWHKQKSDSPADSFGGIKPYFSHLDSNPKENDPYRSIHDITDTSDANEAGESEREAISEDNRVYIKNKSRSKVRQLNGNELISRTKCRAGICRKKLTNSIHRARPALKKIKRIVYNY